MNQKRKLTRKEKSELSRQTAQVKPGKIKTGRSSSLTAGLALIAAIFGFLLYAGTIGYQYTLDDYAAIEKNYLVKQGIKGIGTLLHTSYWEGFQPGNGSLYRPISLVMFAFEWQLFPNQPAASHFMNVLLYAITGWLLFRFLTKLFGNPLIAFGAAMLFMAHPVHTEVVANIKSRDEILCMLFSIASLSWLLDYILVKNNSRIMLAAIAFFFALLSKEGAITLIAVIPVMLYFFADKKGKDNLLLLIPFLAAALVYLAISASVQHGNLVAKTELLTNNILSNAGGYFEQASTAMFVLGKYLWLLLFPLELSIDYSFAEITLMNFTDYRVLISLVVCLALVVFAVYRIRKKDALAFSTLYFFLTISIVSNLVIVIGTVMAERLLYMPSLGFTMAFALLLAKIFPSSPELNIGVLTWMKRNNKSLLLLSAVLVMYSAKTLSRNKIWEDNDTLFTAGIRDAPNSAYIHYIFANEMIRNSGEVQDTSERNRLLDLALSEYKKSAEINPGDAASHSEIGATYRKKKMNEQAIIHYDKALSINPRLSQALNGKGVVYFEVNMYKEALHFFSEAHRMKPNDSEVLGNIGSCYLVMGDNDKAIDNYSKFLQYNPNDAQVLKYMGMAYQNKGDKNMADEYFSRSQKAQQGSPKK